MKCSGLVRGVVTAAVVLVLAGCVATPRDEPAPLAIDEGSWTVDADGFNAYTRQVRARPDDADAWFRLGMMYLGHRQPDRARTCFERATALDPAHFDAHLQLAVCRGDTEAAISSYDRAVALRPDDPRAHEFRGRTLGRMGRVEEAMEAFDLAAAVQPGRPMFNRGVTLAEWGRYEEAAAVLESVVVDVPASRNARIALGWCRFELKQFEQALTAFDEAAALDPYGRTISWGTGDAMVHMWRGLTLSRLGREREALDAYDLAVSLEPRLDEFASRAVVSGARE